MTSRSDVFAALREDPCVSVLILGGGINGVGLMRELALQGVDCLLVDKGDFASGASSKSSRMIHGGLRYLETGEVALVRESLLERNRLLANAPHFVAPLKTTIPMFSYWGGLWRSLLIFLGAKVPPGSRGVAPVKVGLTFYDWVTRAGRRTPKHFFSSRADTLAQMPGLREDIIGAANYWDAWITQAERLCIELVEQAEETCPAARALNYVAVTGVDETGVLLEDVETGRPLRVEPQIVINATGGWVDLTNRLLGLDTHYMGGTKGSHLVVDNADLLAALGDRMVYYQHVDGRVCIAFPFLGKVIMGSTDIRCDNPDEAVCDEEQIDYMLDTLRGAMPGILVSRDQVVYTFCGVRPLPASDGQVLANVSRGHAVRVDEPTEERPYGVLSLVGGKWTTFRAFAEQVADQVMTVLGAERLTETRDVPIGGGENFPADDAARQAWIDDAAARTPASADRAADLLARYGVWAEDYLLDAKPADEQPLAALPGYSVGEIRHIARHEAVMHLDDLVLRRSVIGLLGDATPEAIAELAQVVGEVLGWDAQRREAEIARCRAAVGR
ncbi:MAG: glycerol-3-phosphate dehydrogenase/oxidase [Armatimonadetes bacterium]|nr:glycerol-3-phosphate dehydrogenase/oxidase [Armatimonadota bacterium]